MKYICQYCGKELKNKGALKMHENTCILNSNRENNIKNRKPREIIYNENDLICQYCGQKFKNKSSKTQHEAICKLNPNRIARTIRQKYDMMSNEELLNEVKKYSSRKDTPYQLISVCKERNIYSWTGQYSKEHFLTDDELINELNKYELKKDIPYTIKSELKRRNIKLPNRFNLNPKRIYNKDLPLKSDDELLNIVKDIKDKYEASEKNLLHIIEELEKRNILPERFNQNITYSKFHYYTTEELLKIINNYKSKNALFKAGFIECLNELNKRGITNLPKYCSRGRYTEWHYKTDDELIEIIKSIKNRKELEDKGLLSILKELKNRNIDTSKFTKNYHPEYFNMTDDELIKLGKDIFNGYNIRQAIISKKDRPLINQLRNRNILYQVFVDSNPNIYKNRYKKMKLDILTEYDLLSMDWAVIFDLIGIDMLPKAFKKLYKFGKNTEERDKIIKELIEKYNYENTNSTNNINTNINNVDDNDTNSIEVTVDTVDKKDINNFSDSNTVEDKELKPFKDNKDIGLLAKKNSIGKKIFSVGDKWEHIISKQKSQLWSLVFSDEENHNTNTIDTIKSKLSEELTEFERYLYTEFLKEYNDAINLEIL